MGIPHDIRRMHDAIRDRAETPRRVHHCRRVRVGAGGSHVSPRAVVVERPGRAASAHWTGVQTCGLIHECPSCMMVAARARAEELAHVASGMATTGWVPLLVTLTVRHHAGQDARRLVEGLQRAWARVHRGAEWARWRRRMGGVETVRGTETTYGEHGPHPHIHAIVWIPRRAPGELMDDGLPWDEGRREGYQTAVSDWYQGRWHDAVEAELGPECRPSIEHGADVTAPGHEEAAAQYCAKLGLELTLGPAKAGIGQTPLAILARWIETRDDADWRAWRAHCDAWRGVRALTWSRGLTALRQAHEETEDAETTRTVALTTTDETWDTVARYYPDAISIVLSIAERGADPSPAWRAAVLRAESIRDHGAEQTAHAWDLEHGIAWREWLTVPEFCTPG